MKRLTLAAALLGATMLTAAAAQTPDVRPSFAEPSLSPDGAQIAFASGGDIWEVAASGGTAHLLASDSATESRPLYAPDGRKLAFASNRSGNTNIYLLDFATGTTTRLTYAETNEELAAWSADGKWLYFSSGAHDPGGSAAMYRVAATGGTPMEVAGDPYVDQFHGAPSPDGGQIAVMARGISQGQWWRNGHSHIDETELWVKGTAEAAPFRKLLADNAKHAWPLWTPDGQTLYFMSDKSGTENLWRMPAAGGQAQPVTSFTDGRLLFPAMAVNGAAIVFERNMAVWRLDPATGQAAPVPIVLRGASAGQGRRHLNVSNFDHMALAQDGLKVAVIGHGELFAGPLKDGGPAQRITTSVGAERQAAWSPDSKKLLYVTERGLDHLVAEYDVAAGKETMLTTDGTASAVAYAPDGKSAVYVRGVNELHLLTLPRPGQAASDRVLFTGALATDEAGPLPVWSPDGKYIAFPVVDGRSFTNVHVIAATGGTARPISFLANGNMGRITWSPDGSYILFDTAQRTEDSRIVRVDLLPHVPKYREDSFRELFDPASPPGKPEVTPPGTTAPPEKSAKAAPAKKKADAPKAAPKPVTIVFDGIRDRATILPIGLNAQSPVISGDGKTLVFAASERGQDNFYSYDLDELADEPPVAKQITSSAKPKGGDFALTADGKTLVYLDGGTLIATPIDSAKPKPVGLSGEMDVDFATEKQVVFDEAWSTLNRNFFDPQFTGHDWKALRERFQPYVAGARTSDELRRIINLMIGELNASHSGIGAPRGPGSPPREHIADLGLRFDREAYEGGKGLIVRSLVTLGPADIEGHIKPGDRLVSVDGTVIERTTNLDSLLANKADERVVLGIDSGGTRRTAIVRPISGTTAQGLAYRQWVNSRRAYVEKMSGGRLGYVHMRDMSSEALAQLYIDLDTQNQAKQGVVIDIRDNNGGFVNGFAIDVFSRRNYLTMIPRDLFPVPSRQALGQRALGLPTALVINESTLSDGEDFTEGYRTLGLGKVVGQPTAGWIIFTGGEQLIDGSGIRRPGVRILGSKGDDMELHPRQVDIAVERPLGEVAAGRDSQLDAAIAALVASPAAK